MRTAWTQGMVTVQSSDDEAAQGKHSIRSGLDLQSSPCPSLSSYLLGLSIREEVGVGRAFLLEELPKDESIGTGRKREG